MLMESKPNHMLLILSRSEEGTPKSNAKIQFRETSPDTERIKYNTNGIKTGSSNTLICSKSREGTAESSGTTRFSNTPVDVQ